MGDRLGTRGAVGFLLFLVHEMELELQEVFAYYHFAVVPIYVPFANRSKSLHCTIQIAL